VLRDRLEVACDKPAVGLAGGEGEPSHSTQKNRVPPQASCVVPMPLQLYPYGTFRILQNLKQGKQGAYFGQSMEQADMLCLDRLVHKRLANACS
jgi:hypothetical protein